MLLLLIAGCAGSGEARLAGWRQVAYAADADGNPDYVLTREYDAAGHLAIERWEKDDRVEVSVGTWEGDCPALYERTSTRDGEVEQVVYTTACDAADDPIRVDSAYVDVTDGVTQTLTGSVTYTNEHDDAWRLTRVRARSGEGYGQVRVYGWGDCDDPIVYVYENDVYEGGGGDSGVYTSTCDAAGRTTEVDRAYYDASGEPWGESRSTYAYDAYERKISEAGYSGGSTPDYEYAMHYDDWTSPGPDTETLRLDGDVVETWTFAYERVR